MRDMEIVDYIVENVSFFVRGEIPYYYEHGVFIEDTKGVKLKFRIQKLIYRDQVNSSTIQRVYNLLITQPQIYRNSYELNKQPAHWINFRNAYYDVLSGELIEHDPKYLTINQIPFPYYPEDREKVLESGANIRKYLDSSIPDKVEQQMFWEYFGYCMTMAVNKTINKRTNTHGAMRNCIEYVLRQDKTSEQLTYVTGPYCLYKSSSKSFV